MTKMLINRAVVEQALKAWQTSSYGQPSHQKAMVLAMTNLHATLAEPETTCRRAICQRGPDGYCAPCHEEPVQEPVADRAAFERHAERLGYSVDPDTREGREGGYWSSHTQLMWLTWQAALAEPVQKTEMRRCPRCWEPMFPPQRKPLTREQAIALWADKSDGPSNSEIVSFARAVERAHGIK